MRFAGQAAVTARTLTACKDSKKQFRSECNSSAPNSRNGYRRKYLRSIPRASPRCRAEALWHAWPMASPKRWLYRAVLGDEVIFCAAVELCASLIRWHWIGWIPMEGPVRFQRYVRTCSSC